MLPIYKEQDKIDEQIARKCDLLLEREYEKYIEREYEKYMEEKKKELDEYKRHLWHSGNSLRIGANFSASNYANRNHRCFD